MKRKKNYRGKQKKDLSEGNMSPRTKFAADVEKKENRKSARGRDEQWKRRRIKKKKYIES